MELFNFFSTQEEKIGERRAHREHECDAARQLGAAARRHTMWSAALNVLFRPSVVLHEAMAERCVLFSKQ